VRTLAFTTMLLAGTLACARGGPTAVVHTADGRSLDVALEVARTQAEQERGLMYRSALADGHGMIFLFDVDQDHQFWMKNTLIPLDMVFVAQDSPTTGHIVGIHENATPLTTNPRGVGKPSRWVIEVPGGWSKRNGVAAGDGVELRDVSGRSG
jgi:uncharacterized membrane protein (UPF0127 family)